MAADHANAQGRDSNGLAIVVLTHPSAPVPARLLQALQRRGTRVQLVTDAPMVMAELAFANKAVMIVNQSQRFASLDRLLAAIATYYPQTDCWRFDDRAEGDEADRDQPRFVKLELPTATTMEEASVTPDATAEPRHRERDESAASEPEVAPVSEIPARPSLRIAGDDESAGEEEDVEPLLTADELEMLLGSHANPRDASASR